MLHSGSFQKAYIKQTNGIINILLYSQVLKDRPSSTEEVMLQQEMKKYWYYRINLYQCIGFITFVEYVDSDILQHGYSSLVNIVRVLILLITSSLNLELYKPSAID